MQYPAHTFVARLTLKGSMTAGAQQALRRTMEIYANTTRFALACNMSNKIIEPIQSRCAILRYSKLRDQEVLKRLLEICEMEKVRPRPPRRSVGRLTRHFRWNTATRVSKPSYSPRKGICDKQSTTCSQHSPALALSLGTTCSKSATNHILSPYKP